MWAADWHSSVLSLPHVAKLTRLLSMTPRQRKTLRCILCSSRVDTFYRKFRYYIVILRVILSRIIPRKSSRNNGLDTYFFVPAAEKETEK